jgi:hypothetical protein
MVLTKYSEKKEEKDSIETTMTLIEFSLLDQSSSNSVIFNYTKRSFELVKTLKFMAPSPHRLAILPPRSSF